jgi:methylenetetrahydrofolate dehydrogenase (NADP+)/methenyltetrahydrofolate cyclohydrolase
MRQFVLQNLRERHPLLRRLQCKLRGKHSVALQLDYYLSPQFGGVAGALVNGLYDGLDLSFLPICPVGLEQERVRKWQDDNAGSVTLGSVEQNIFIPTLRTNPNLKVKAVAAMFRRSPLCVASLDTKERMLIGAHEDTVSLLKRIFPEHEVVASPRSSKITDLIAGKVGGIQAYLTTEVPAIRYSLGKEPVVVPLEGLNGAKIGYGQVLFAAEEALVGDRREVVSAFLDATFKGWEMVVRDPNEGVKMVKEAKKMLGLDDEQNDHWHSSAAFELEMLQLCNDYVKETFEGDRLGVINASRWNDATDWLLDDDKSAEENFGLEPSLWQPPSQVLAGNELGRTLMEKAKASATLFRDTYGRKPSLSVITVGELKRYTHAERRLQLYSNTSNSWFSKTKSGEANGFDVTEISLDASTTTDDLLSVLYKLKDQDGIQLMWPLPDRIDKAKVYNAIAVSKDVDGIHYVGQQGIGNRKAFAPVTPAATMALIKKHGVAVQGKKVLVIGRSPIVGSPVANMLLEQGAIVTVAHSDATEALEGLVRDAEVIVTCAGCPGLVKAEWIKGEVINVGTTFLDETDSLHSDVDGNIGEYATRYSPVPGGVGPLSAPLLFNNVAQAAWDRMKGDVAE